ncbi:hypothetical protein CFIO01_04120 [Colletotrichum fioriniae PJ7]|uniref:Uncharacterized protein n=1 Tax=Colletotrichum fioriniae PJ7 TaxID=1445577 RepID=A0A010RCB4_9PEZI|nr:hypothetical protein CFIO01_04120 [Colletotrichum fioriniae PJ7]
MSISDRTALNRLKQGKLKQLLKEIEFIGAGPNIATNPEAIDLHTQLSLLVTPVLGSEALPYTELLFNFGSKLYSIRSLDIPFAFQVDKSTTQKLLEQD